MNDKPKYVQDPQKYMNITIYLLIKWKWATA
jgi:hypothetical protein